MWLVSLSKTPISLITAIDNGTDMYRISIASNDRYGYSVGLKLDKQTVVSYYIVSVGVIQ